MIKQLMAVALAAQIVLGIGPAKVQAEDIVATNALTTDSASPITEMVADDHEQNRVKTWPHVFADVIKSGTWGTCSWSLSSDGVLTIGVGTGESTYWGTYAPWYSQRTNIESVKLDGKVKLPQSVEGLFADCSNLVTLDVSSWDTSAVTNMSNMFYGCSSLTTLDVSKWDTSAVTNMGNMFRNCSSLTTLDTSNWDTSKVTEMGSMFHECNNLTTLDVSGWDTGKVTNVSHMFDSCKNLTALGVSEWNTGAVTDMSAMFQGCSNLTTLDVSGWKTGAVTNMSAMFYDCSRLTALDVSKWDTSAVTDMHSMFKNCSKFTTLDVSNWNAGAVTDMSYMFSDCRSLTTLDVSNWKIGAVTNMYDMFGNCSKLTTLDVSRWNTSTVKNMGWMFSGCSSLTTLDVSNWSTSAATNMGLMFSGCGKLTALDVSKWNTSAVKDMQWMFNGCSSLTTLDVSKWDTSAVKNMALMFSGCRSLTTLNVSNWNTGAVTNMRSMFDSCSSLTTLDVSKWDTSAVTDMNYMFRMLFGRSSLTTLDVSNWDTSAVTNMSSMFDGFNTLTTLDVSKWDTSAVTNMNNMFYSCDNITALDVSNWDTSKVTNMNRLFYESGLRKIKIGSGFVNSAKSNEVFPTPKITISGRTSTKTWGLGSETADKQYKADELATLGQTAGALTGTWYAQGKQELSFISWNTKPDGSGTAYMPGDALPDANLDLYAQWAYDFDYTGAVQQFTAPVSGTYKLEVWGAGSGIPLNQGAQDPSAVGRGGYSYGNVSLTKGDTLYISVGGKGEDAIIGQAAGGWNGGGSGEWDHTQDEIDAGQSESLGGGGGATSIQRTLIDDGQLKRYEAVKDTDVLIVAGGAGSMIYSIHPDGGGESDIAGEHGPQSASKTLAIPGTQTSGYAFGQGGSAEHKYFNSELGAGGGGWYGGGAAIDVGDRTYVDGAGGSGHIGAMLTNGATVAGNQSFSAPDGSAETGHSGNGYARITLISAD